QGLRLAQTLQDPALLSAAHHWLGFLLCAVGELTSARARLEQGLTFYNSLQDRSVALRVGVEDAEVSCLNWLDRVLWALGYPEQALQRSKAGLPLAAQLSHPYSLAFTLHCAARLHHFRREVQVAKERAEAEIALSSEQGFPYWLSWGTIWRGW